MGKIVRCSLRFLFVLLVCYFIGWAFGYPFPQMGLSELIYGFLFTFTATVNDCLEERYNEKA